MAQKSGRSVAGGFVDRSHELGHRLRDRALFDAPRRQRKIPLVIAGGGIAGLSAAWRLDKRGFRDFAVLEMEPRAGGNSRWGEHAVSPFAWAAHYVPVPGPRAVLVRELLEDLGVLRNGQFEERYLCYSPQERLFIHGRWQEGIEPASALAAADRDQFQRFAGRMAAFRASGQFTIPLEDGARPSELDRLSMQEWLRREGFTSPPLDWYVNYGCRDDYGARAAAVSAWAGIHYFAAREPEDKGPLTWPEGNGWIVKRLRSQLEKQIRPDSLVFHLVPGERSAFVEYFDVRRQQSTRIKAEQVIVACPRQFARYLLSDAREGAQGVEAFEYAPWM
ncbi:MAG: FAD-dependent oxidoreductase, partial [Terriglobales bacterium]